MINQCVYDSVWFTTEDIMLIHLDRRILLIVKNCETRAILRSFINARSDTRKEIDQSISSQDAFFWSFTRNYFPSEGSKIGRKPARVCAGMRIEIPGDSISMWTIQEVRKFKAESERIVVVLERDDWNVSITSISCNKAIWYHCFRLEIISCLWKSMSWCCFL